MTLCLFDEMLLNPDGANVDACGLGVLNRQRATGGGARSTITDSSITAGSSTTDAASFNTASVSPVANRPHFLAVVHQATSVATPTVTGAGMTWVQVATRTFASSRRITVFRACHASPTTGALTIDFAGQTQSSCIWNLVACAGADSSGTDGSGSVVQSLASNSATGATSHGNTLAAFEHANNHHLAFVALATADVVTPDADFAEISDGNVAASNLTLESESAANQTNCTATFLATTAAMISIEVKAG